MQPSESARNKRESRGNRRRSLVGGIVGIGAALLLVMSTSQVYAALDPTDTATGTGALTNENGGSYNTADGYYSLNQNTSGYNNTAVGAVALSQNTDGFYNTAVGDSALANNSSGFYNTAVGESALGHNLASYDTATGFDALGQNDGGTDGVANGVYALANNTTGNNNTASGASALIANLDGNNNTAVGEDALASNYHGNGNTALGYEAGHEVTSANANTNGSYNTFIGYSSGPGTSTQLRYATAIGALARVRENYAVVLGGAGTNVGAGNTAPQSTFQVGTVSSTWGSYLQPPVVKSADASPPATSCNTSTFVGRLVLEYNTGTHVTTLWNCTAAGTWVAMAHT